MTALVPTRLFVTIASEPVPETRVSDCITSDEIVGVFTSESLARAGGEEWLSIRKANDLVDLFGEYGLVRSWPNQWVKREERDREGGRMSQSEAVAWIRCHDADFELPSYDEIEISVLPRHLNDVHMGGAPQ